MYYCGDGVKKNKSEAIKWLNFAAMQGFRLAKTDLERIMKSEKPKGDYEEFDR
jgi:TPR repeat protein